MVPIIFPLEGFEQNKLTTAANCGDVRLKFREEEEMGRRKLDRKSAKADNYKLLASRDNGSIFVHSY